MNPAGPLRILVVEDHHDSCVMMKRLLASAGHHAVLAESVSAALEAARSTAIDMVICDITLPDGDGCTLMQTLRETYGVPSIAVSGHVDEEHKRRAEAAGVCVHLCKPVKFEALLDAIEECRSAHTAS
jgi:CheY-like chemotaxis protein